MDMTISIFLENRFTLSSFSLKIYNVNLVSVVTLLGVLTKSVTLACLKVFHRPSWYLVSLAAVFFGCHATLALRDIQKTAARETKDLING